MKNRKPIYRRSVNEVGPPPSGRGGVHLNKALPYKVTSHRKNIDRPFKEANLRYDMVFFLSKSRLIVTFMKSDSIPIDQIYYVIIFRNVFDYFDDALDPRICSWSVRRVIYAYGNTGNTLVAPTSSISTFDGSVDKHL